MRFMTAHMSLTSACMYSHMHNIRYAEFDVTLTHEQTRVVNDI